MGAIFCGEVTKSNNQEDLEEWLGDSGASLHINYMKINLTNVEECKIDIIVRNGQKMKCEIKGTVNVKIQGG